MGTNEKLLNSLNEAKRDALVPYYLQHVIPTRLSPSLASKIKTPEDLYEYLLLDPQVSAQVKTSRIAEATASTQLYLHRCREHLEPEVDAAAMSAASESGRFFTLWDAYGKRYATWAGLQRLLHYPASYLDPELRYSKTSLFRELEDALNQGRITEERVEQAFTQYVTSLRNVLQLRVLSGYQVEPTHAKGPTYFCGAAREAPTEFYWRRVESSDWTGTAPPVQNPIGWSEWRKIEAAIQPAPGTVPAIVFFNNRIHVLCLHQRPDGVEGKPLGARARADQDPDWFQPEPTFVWELQFATLSPSGQWRLRTWPLQELIPDIGTPARIFACELRRSTEHPTLGVFFKAADEARSPLLCRFNHLFERLDSPSWNFRFSHQNGYYPDYSEIRVFQPLEVTPGGAQPSMRVKEGWVIDHVRYRATEFEVSASGSPLNCEFSVTINNRGPANWFTLQCQSGNETPVFSNTVSFEGGVTKNARFVLPILYDTVASDSAYGIMLREGYGAESRDIPLERTPAGDIVDFYDPTKSLWIRAARNALGASQILIFVADGAHHKRYVLTTLGGARLERKMLEGLDNLLSWELQNELVDPDNDAGSNTVRKLPFEGGVGLYTWELFFHAPFLVASRLLTEQRFAEAETWFRRIFNPAGYRNSEGELDMVGATPRYWNVRPLQEHTTWNPSMPIGTDDPDLIAAADPMHYKLAVYLRWLELLMARGDQAYRQQTRDSLAEAKMWYVQVLQLLGPRPELPLALQWGEPTLESAAAASNPLLRWLEELVDNPVGKLPAPLAPGLLEQVGLLDSPFRAPLNDAVLAYWDRAEGRLANLRRHLSINGQPLALPLFEPPASPTSLQHARQAGDAAGGGTAGGRPALWSQRFPVLLERARQAVQQVMQFGSTLQGILERRDADALTVLQQTHQGALLALAQSVQAENKRSLEFSLCALKKTRDATCARYKHFLALHEEHISRNEQLALTRLSEAIIFRQVSAAFQGVGGLLDIAPNIFIGGAAVGTGIPPAGSGMRAAGTVADLFALEKEGNARKRETSEQYRRRQQEWKLQRDQAEGERDQLDEQIKATEAQIEMVVCQIDQVAQEQAYSQAVLDVLNTRFSGQTLFNWLAGRLATLYYQIYDAASSLCGQAQASYAWETNDTKPYLRPGQWNDVYQGLMAGEGLLLSLQQMENAYLAWDRRCLEVRKTVSLHAVSGQMLSKMVSDLLNGDTPQSSDVEVKWDASDNTALTVEFGLDKLAIKDDYPTALQLGSKRFLKQVSVSLPMLMGPYQDVQAVLRFSGALVPDGCHAIAVSHGLNDSGQFQLDFNDGKYLPFEGAPVDDGRFSLVFPRANTAQKDLLLSLTDIIVHLNYTIRN